MLPVKIGPAEVQQMISRVTRTMSEKSWIYGTPKKVAADLKAYVDAGATWVVVIDMLPCLLEAAESMTAVQRSIEVCRLLKA